jgi:hypothetical protein
MLFLEGTFMRGKTEQMIEKMAVCVDTDRVLEEVKLTEKQALALLRNKAGRRLMASRRRLSKMHVEIVACRYSPFAVQKLCELIDKGKEEIKLKGALSLLGLAGLGKAAAKGKKKEARAVEEPTAEDLKLMELVARVMNPPPPPEEPDLEVSQEEGQKDIDNGVDSK